MFASPEAPNLTPATMLAAIVPCALPVPEALTSCFLAWPIAAPRTFLPLSVSEALAFALIEPPAPKDAVTTGGRSGT